MEIHRQMWPGIDIDRLTPKGSRLVRGDDTQDVWLQEATRTTSMFIAFIVFCISSKFRMVADRAHSSEGLSALISTLASTLGGFDLEHCRFGSANGELPLQLHVDVNGCVQTSQFWTPEFYASSCRSSWRSDYKNTSKTWVTMQSGRDCKTGLNDLICFCLDPQHGDEFRDTVVAETLDLMTELANLLDRGVSLLLRDVCNLFDPALNFKNKRRMANNVKKVWVEAAARKVWSGTEPRFCLASHC